VTLILDLVRAALSTYIFIILGRFLLSWVPLRSGTPLYRVSAVLYALTEPYLRLFRPWIPTVRLGNAALDLSSLTGVVVLIIAARIVAAL